MANQIEKRVLSGTGWYLAWFNPLTPDRLHGFRHVQMDFIDVGIVSTVLIPAILNTFHIPEQENGTESPIICPVIPVQSFTPLNVLVGWFMLDKLNVLLS